MAASKPYNPSSITLNTGNGTLLPLSQATAALPLPMGFSHLSIPTLHDFRSVQEDLRKSKTQYKAVKANFRETQKQLTCAQESLMETKHKLDAAEEREKAAKATLVQSANAWKVMEKRYNDELKKAGLNLDMLREGAVFSTLLDSRLLKEKLTRERIAAKINAQKAGQQIAKLKATQTRQSESHLKLAREFAIAQRELAKERVTAKAVLRTMEAIVYHLRKAGFTPEALQNGALLELSRECVELRGQVKKEKARFKSASTRANEHLAKLKNAASLTQHKYDSDVADLRRQLARAEQELEKGCSLAELATMQLSDLTHELEKAGFSLQALREGAVLKLTRDFSNLTKETINERAVACLASHEATAKIKCLNWMLSKSEAALENERKAYRDLERLRQRDFMEGQERLSKGLQPVKEEYYEREAHLLKLEHEWEMERLRTKYEMEGESLLVGRNKVVQAQTQQGENEDNMRGSTIQLRKLLKDGIERNRSGLTELRDVVAMAKVAMARKEATRGGTGEVTGEVGHSRTQRQVSLDTKQAREEFEEGVHRKHSPEVKAKREKGGIMQPPPLGQEADLNNPAGSNGEQLEEPISTLQLTNDPPEDLEPQGEESSELKDVWFDFDSV